MSTETSSEPTYRVVRNDEEHYSIYRVDRDLPAGWLATPVEGTREECLAAVNELWTDMRPRSLRERLGA